MTIRSLPFTWPTDLPLRRLCFYMGCASRYAPLLPLLFLGLGLVWVGQQGASKDGEGASLAFTQLASQGTQGPISGQTQVPSRPCSTRRFSVITFSSRQHAPQPETYWPGCCKAPEKTRKRARCGATSFEDRVRPPAGYGHSGSVGESHQHPRRPKCRTTSNNRRKDEHQLWGNYQNAFLEICVRKRNYVPPFSNG